MSGRKPININPGELSRGGGTLERLGGSLESGGGKLADAGQRLAQHAAQDKSGIGKVLTEIFGRGTEVAGDVIKEGGRVVRKAGEHLHETGQTHAENDRTSAGHFTAIRTKGGAPTTHGGGTSASGTGGGGAHHGGTPPHPHGSGGGAGTGGGGTGGGGGTPPHLPGSGGTGGGGGGGINHYDANGKVIPTRNLQHPQASLLDQNQLAAAANNPNRASDALRPGVDMNDPSVNPIMTGYHPHGYDANGNPMTQAQWNGQYWSSGQYSNRGDRQLDWPDPQTHPDGFASPQDRHPIVLQPGQQIDRFGPGFGQFASPPGTPFPQRGLPPDNVLDMRNPSLPHVNPGAPTPSYHRYEVVAPIPVWAGQIAPAMGQPGGGLQYYTPTAIVDLVNAGYLREVP